MGLPGNRLPVAVSLLFLLLVSSTCVSTAGLTGEYFDNSDFTSLQFVRIDPMVGFNWDLGAPASGIGADSFSVRWSGQVEPQYSETYSFHVTADDGARLWVNDRLLVCRTIYSSAGLEMAGRIQLKAGQRYNLVLEFVENSGSAQISLAWSSARQPLQIIPETRLFPALGSPDAGSILVEHWNSLPGTNLSSLAESPNFPDRPDGREFLTSFESLQPGWNDAYGSRASGFILAPCSGPYSFAVSGDDTVQLFLSTDDSASNKQLIASNSVATGFRQFSQWPGQESAEITLVGSRRYYVELLHKEGTGDDHFSVAWKKPGDTAYTVIPASALAPAGLDRVAPAQTAFLDTLVPAHPRLLASSQRFEWLKQTLQSRNIPQLNSWWGSVSNSASSVLRQPVNQYTAGGILDQSRSVMSRTYLCALAYRVTGITNFAERVWTEMEQVASTNFPDWNPAHFLDTAEMTHACAIGYDWLHDYWTPARRTTIRGAIINKGLTPSVSLYSNNSGWVAPGANNWNLVCNGGMIMGALAVGTESESMAEYILFRAVPSARAVMQRYTTDNGGWYEGPMYWNYATAYNVRMMASLESALGSDFGLSMTPGLAETGQQSLYLVGPGSKVAFNFADASAYNLRGPQLFWLSRRFNRPEFSWWSRTNSGVEPLDLLWYDARGEDPLATGLQPDNYFRGLTGTTPYAPAEIVTLRSGWQDPTATFVGLKAGELGASHGHLDGGSFVIEALGKRWAHDFGGDDYGLPGYFSKPQRWTYYRLRAEGHNTLVINPGSSADQISGSELPILFYSSEPNAERAAVVTDLTPAYGITKVWRGIQLFKNRRWTLIQDEIQAASPAEVWWFMHYRSSTTAATIHDNGTSVTLTQGTERLWLSIVSGGGVFAISNAVPLPNSPNPSDQASNDTYRKLAIHLPAVTNTTLAVLMVPLSPGQYPPTGSLSLVPLENWAISMTNNMVVNSTIKWTGAASGIWNTNAVNWLSGSGTPTSYIDGDFVRFDDSLSGTPLITLDRTVSPGGVTFSNATKAYSLNGSGSIAGQVAMTKEGTNRLFINTTNTFSGPVIIGGRVVINNHAALGKGPKEIGIRSLLGMYAELHLDGSAGPVILPSDLSFSTYGDSAFAGNIVNDAGHNVINSYFNMVSGGGHTKFRVVQGSLTVNGIVNCSNGSSNKQLQLDGTGTNTINGVIQDGTRKALLGVFGGTWILTGTNNYTGATTVATNGTLVVEGSLANTPLTVQNGGALRGPGRIEGAVTVQAGARIEPATSIDALTLGNSLTLQGTTIMKISRTASGLSNDRITGVTTNTYGGALVIMNVGTHPLQVGDSFHLFNASRYAGGFASITYPNGYTFENSLAVDGRIRVTGVPLISPPAFSQGGITLSPDGKVSMTVTGAIGTPYRLWASTNVNLRPVTNTWVLLTNGNLTVSPFQIQDTAATNFSQRFYLFSTP